MDQVSRKGLPWCQSHPAQEGIRPQTVKIIPNVMDKLEVRVPACCVVADQLPDEVDAIALRGDQALPSKCPGSRKDRREGLLTNAHHGPPHGLGRVPSSRSRSAASEATRNHFCANSILRNPDGSATKAHVPFLAMVEWTRTSSGSGSAAANKKLHRLRYRHAPHGVLTRHGIGTRLLCPAASVSVHLIGSVCANASSLGDSGRLG